MLKAISPVTKNAGTFFCLLSGENPTLPAAEVEAILESEKQSFTSLPSPQRLMRFRTSTYGAEAIVLRAAYTRVCCRELFVCEADECQILKTARESQYDELLKPDEAFKVEVIKVGPGATSKVDSIEREVGRTILKLIPNAKVSLSGEVKTFFGVSTDKKFVLGLGIAGRPRGTRLQDRPFFHPAAMDPKLARCMVNLSRAKPRSSFLDPFCGTGSQLIEAASIGSSVLGADIDSRMIHGTSQNLHFTRIEEFSLCVADARAPPFRFFDSCAFDPPYGRESSSHGTKPKDLLEVFLEKAMDLMPQGGHICLAFPKYGGIGETGRAIGYELRDSHQVREHKNLTREITVLRRP